MAIAKIRRRRNIVLVILAYLFTPQAHSSGLWFQVAEPCKQVDGVSQWPSFSEGVVCTFYRDKDDLQTLLAMMADVDYSTVVNLGEGRLYGYNSPLESETAQGTLPNSDRWLELMNQTQTRVLKHSQDAAIFSTKTFASPPHRVDTLYYLTGEIPEAKKCDEKFRDIACGICDVARVDSWTIRYIWSSGRFIEEYFRSPSESAGEGLPDEADSLARADKFNQTNFECLRRGLEEMGYENPADFF